MRVSHAKDKVEIDESNNLIKLRNCSQISLKHFAANFQFAFRGRAEKIFQEKNLDFKILLK